MVDGVLHGLEHDLTCGLPLTLHLRIQLDNTFAHGVLAGILGRVRVGLANLVHSFLKRIADLFHMLFGRLGSLGITVNLLDVDIHNIVFARKVASAEKQRRPQKREKQKFTHRILLIRNSGALSRPFRLQRAAGRGQKRKTPHKKFFFSVYRKTPFHATPEE